MGETPARKRPVSASKTVAAKKRPATRVQARRAPSVPLLEDEAPTPNYALRAMETPASAANDEDSFALRLNQALEAITAAQGSTVAPTAQPEAQAPQPRRNFFAALDRLPPIRLPIGPAIPWRIGLPALVVLFILMAVMSRSSAHADSPGVQLPAQQTYPVQQEAPLFARADPTPTTEVAQPAAQQPLGVQDPGGFGFDLADIGIKLVAVLGLAYGSLMLLKRAGFGGAGPSKGAGGSIQGMRVISSLALAPNRSVHVIKVPGGRTLLVGATPNAVNLLADLGQLADDELPDAASFFDVLKGKIGS